MQNITTEEHMTLGGLEMSADRSNCPSYFVIRLYRQKLCNSYTIEYCDDN